SSSRADTARSVGGNSFSFRCGKALPCVSHVSLLPRVTCTRLTPASTRRRAISSDQPNELRPYRSSTRGAARGTADASRGRGGVRVEQAGVGAGDVERQPGARVGQHGDGALAELVEAFDRGVALQVAALPIDEAEQVEALVEPARVDALGQGDVRRLEDARLAG